MIGGTTAFINKSESTLATAREETRRITGWRRARETGWLFVAALLSAVSDIAGSLGGVMSPESAASKKLLLLATVLEICPGFASNKNVAFPFLRLRSSNCTTTQKIAHGTPSLVEA